MVDLARSAERSAALDPRKGCRVLADILGPRPRLASVFECIARRGRDDSYRGWSYRLREGCSRHFFQWPTEPLLRLRLIGLAKLWIWAVPGIIPLAVAGWWLRRSDVRIRLLALSCVTTLVGYLFVAFDQGHGWGFRYFHAAWLCLPLLAVAAMATKGQTASRSAQSVQRYASGAAALMLIPATAVQAWQVHDFMDRHLAQLPQSGTGVARVLIVNTATGYYAADLVQNDPFLRGSQMRLISHGRSANEALLHELFNGMTRLSRGYRGEVWGEPEPTRVGRPLRRESTCLMGQTRRVLRCAHPARFRPSAGIFQ